LHDFLRAAAMFFSLSTRLRVASANSLRIWAEQGRAAIDREMALLGSTESTRLPSFFGGSMTLRITRAVRHALGVIGQQHDVARGSSGRMASRSASADLGGSRVWPAPNRAHMWVEECSAYEAHLARRRR